MVDTSAQNPTSLPSPSVEAPPPPLPPATKPNGFIRGIPRRPAVRVTSEYDSDTSLFLHKASCKLFEGLAKLKLSFQNNPEGRISSPQQGFFTKHLSVLYDLERGNSLVKGSFDVSRDLQFKSTFDVKPRAIIRFPRGQVNLEEKQEEEVKRVLSISGILKGQLMNGLCTTRYKDNDLNLRYCYKIRKCHLSQVSLSHPMPYPLRSRGGSVLLTNLATGTTLTPAIGALCTSTQWVRI